MKKMYTYDAANRVIINEGVLDTLDPANKTIVITKDQGEQYTYYANGQRKSVTMLEEREDTNSEPQEDIYYTHERTSQASGTAVSTYKDVQHYSYDADGRLFKVIRQTGGKLRRIENPGNPDL